MTTDNHQRPDDGEFDERIADQFRSLESIPAPDLWDRIRSRRWDRRPATRKFVASAAALALSAATVAVVVVMRRDEQSVDEVTGPPAQTTPSTTDASTGSTSEPGPPPPPQCSDEILVALATPLVSDFNPYYLDVIGTADTALRGTVVDGEIEIAGTAGNGDASDLVADVSVLPEGAEVVVARASDGVAHTWASCGGDPTVRAMTGSVSMSPLNFDRGFGLTIESIWRSVQYFQGGSSSPIAEPLRPDAETAVIDLRLVTEERFRLSLPAAIADDLHTLVEEPDAPIRLEGDSTAITIHYRGCSDQSGSVNDLGSTVSVSDTAITLCRPDEALETVLETTIPVDSKSEQLFDLRPISLGTRYREVLTGNWVVHAGCDNCARWGPYLYWEAGVVVNQLGPTTFAAVDMRDLTERWRIDVGGLGASLRPGPLDGVFVSMDPGAVERRDPATGAVVWRIELDPEEAGAGLWDLGDDWFVTASFTTAGIDRAPTIRAIDIATGQVRWAAQGREGTEWQWSDPALLDTVVVMMDVLDTPQGQVVVAGAALSAYDIATGAQVWRTELQIPSGVFSLDPKLLTALPLRDGLALLVRTTDGQFLRVDPADGRVVWSVPANLLSVDGLQVSPDGTELITVTGPDGRQLFDAATGAAVQ